MRDWNRLKHILHGICRVLELVCAALMVAGILLYCLVAFGLAAAFGV